MPICSPYYSFKFDISLQNSTLHDKVKVLLLDSKNLNCIYFVLPNKYAWLFIREFRVPNFTDHHDYSTIHSYFAGVKTIEMKVKNIFAVDFMKRKDITKVWCF